jgi:hypothetical protein
LQGAGHLLIFNSSLVSLTVFDPRQRTENNIEKLISFVGKRTPEATKEKYNTAFGFFGCFSKGKIILIT